ncbi:hypothetical protein GYMLUDRAFT_235883 [Collybiopsis luxurians FD-317 M1]|nr:hypothetical protein GYMLUDRAFT_235883 [Collybiopsis luxurians FD-317 M1]
MPEDRKPVPPNPPRWKPNPDPMSIEIPGLDTAASPQDQIEQIEQLITLKLQNIDENFAKVHHILSTRILPAVKRYAVGTEPVREAAKFWVSFYERAAQIRIPTFEDYGNATANEEEGSSQQTAAEPSGSSSPSHTSASTSADQPKLGVVDEEAEDHGHDHNHSIASAESSFAPGPFSSTPAADRLAHPADDTDASWSASLESPLVRLDRELKNFSRDANETDSSIAAGSPTPSKPKPPPPPPSFSSSVSSSVTHTHTHTQRSIDKGKSKAREQPERSLLKNLLRQNIYSSTTANFSPSPTKGKGKPYPSSSPLKEMNPFLPPGTNPSKWNGLVDLRDTPSSSFAATTPVTSKRSRIPVSHQRKPFTPKDPKGNDGARDHASGNAADSDSDDSFDGLPPGMSPPVLMSPARPIKSSIKLGQTPGKAAAARITKDMVTDVQSRYGGGGGGAGGSKPKPVRGLFGANANMNNNARVGGGGGGGGARGTLLGTRAGMGMGTDSSMSTVSTPPSLSKYNLSGTSSGMVTDSSLESMMRQVGLRDSKILEGGSREGGAGGGSSYATSSTAGYPKDDDVDSYGGTGDVSQTQVPTGQDDSEGFQTPTPFQRQYQGVGGGGGPFFAANEYDDDDDDDDEEINNTAHPSAAFLMMSQNRRPMGVEDSFDDDDDDDDDDDVVDPMALAMNMGVGQGGVGGDGSIDPNMIIPVHPFARGPAMGMGMGMGMGLEDDSFDDDSFENDMAMAHFQNNYNHPGGGSSGSGTLDTEAVEEETLFGVPPAERERRLSMAQAGMGMGSGLDSGNGERGGDGGVGTGTGATLMMHGGDLFDTSQLTEDIAKVAESPTPAPGGFGRNR